VAFLAVSAACLVALFLMFRLVRKPPPDPDDAAEPVAAGGSATASGSATAGPEPASPA
jgi:hypothetical protein